MPALALPRPMRSEGQAEGPDRCERAGAGPSPLTTPDHLACDRYGAAAAHYRRGEGDRSRGVQARPDGAVPRMPRGRSPGVGGTVGFPPQQR
jgi:hypothetical protein